MDTNGHESDVLYAEEVYQLVGFSLSILKEVGHGYDEKIYENGIVVDTKTIDRISDHERGQMLNYLRLTKLRLGLIINFKHAKLQWERVVL